MYRQIKNYEFEFEHKISNKDADIDKLNNELTECYSNLTDLRQIISLKSECLIKIENICDNSNNML